jgi:transcriptional regulator with XRE-family HTH domain
MEVFSMLENFFSLILRVPLSTGDKIKLIRTRKEIAAKDLAAKLKITVAALRHYEDGIRQVNDERLQEIADNLNVNVSALYDRRISTVTDVMHTLFEIENAGFIQPDKYPIPENETSTPYGVRSINEILNIAIEQWLGQRDLWIKGEITDEAYQNWKDAFPASVFDTSSQDNVTDSDENVTISQHEPKTSKLDTQLKKHFLLFQSLESRFVSMTYAQEVPVELQDRICSYVNCSAEYLNDRERIKFTPEAPNRAEGENDSNVLFDILDIMDKHTDSEQYRTIQIQLSRIVLYHLAQKGFLTKVLRAKEIPEQKTDYLFEGVKPRFNTMAFGYFYTELAVIRELTGMSYQEMFTGIASN